MNGDYVISLSADIMSNGIELRFILTETYKDRFKKKLDDDDSLIIIYNLNNILNKISLHKLLKLTNYENRIKIDFISELTCHHFRLIFVYAAYIKREKI